MASLLDEARDYITSVVADLEGENDFMPFMFVNSPQGRVYVGLGMPEFGSPRDDIADMMAALLARHRATEVVFASCAWTLKKMSAEERKKWGNRDFGEHPDREEIVFTVYVGSDGDQFHSAPVTRENNKVALGAWNAAEDGRMSGRFHDAMHAGMTLAREMPAEMIAFMEAEITSGNEREILERMVRAHRRARTGDITDEELAEAQRLMDQMQRR